MQMGIMALAIYLALGAVAWLVEHGPDDAADGLPAAPTRA